MKVLSNCIIALNIFYLQASAQNLTDRFSSIAARDEYDQRVRIRCIGNLPDWTVVLSPNEAVSLRQTYESVLDFCAKPASGGSLTAPTAGGYCAYKFSIPTVMFERDGFDSGKISSTHNNRLFILCANRCRCKTPPRPSPGERFPESLMHPGDFPFPEPTNLDPNPPRMQFMSSSMPFPRDHVPLPIPVLQEKAAMTYQQGSPVPDSLRVEWISPNPKYKEIMCFHDPLAVHMIPIHFSQALWTYITFQRLYRNVQEVCAAEWYGGSLFGNAGFVCLKDDIRSQQLPELAHPAFTENGNPADARRILMFCSTHCTCHLEGRSLRVDWQYSGDEVQPEGTHFRLGGGVGPTLSWQTGNQDRVSEYTQSEGGQSAGSFSCGSKRCQSQRDCENLMSNTGCEGLRCIAVKRLGAQGFESSCVSRNPIPLLGVGRGSYSNIGASFP